MVLLSANGWRGVPACWKKIPKAYYSLAQLCQPPARDMEHNLGQRSLCKKVKIKASTGSLLSSFIKEISGRKKYLRVSLSYAIP